MTEEQLQQIIQIARLAVTNEGQAARMLGLVVTDLVAEVRRLQGELAKRVPQVVVPVKRKFATPQHITVGQTYWECPNCGETVCLMRGTAKYCQNCGLELDWSKVER